MDQDDSLNIESIEAGDPVENFHDTLNEMDTDSEESEEPVKKEEE
jgi:phage-related protein